MANTDSTESNSKTHDDSSLSENSKNIESKANEKSTLEARRRIEKILEDRALERLIEGYY